MDRCSHLPITSLLFAFAVIAASAGRGHAQTEIRYADEPTAGINLPGIALSGEHDAFSVSKNPAGMAFLRGFHMGMAVDTGDDTRATRAGQGFGLYLGDRFGGGFLPAFGLGLGLELGRPSRTNLTPDLGTPTRLTLAYALPLGRSLSLGISRHWFYDEDDSVTDGLASWDLGLSMRLGARFALGGTIRDLGAPTDNTGEIVQRRYELELTTRPVATDRLELALGGRVGEVRSNLDGWLRVSTRLTRGLYLRAEVESRALTAVTISPTGESRAEERELIARAGLEISFGALGAAVWGAGARSDAGENRLSSGTVLVRASAERIPSVLGHGQRIERVEITGSPSQRELTSMVLYLRRIARDPGVVAMVVAIDDVGAGWATIEELWHEIGRVRAAGKKVYAYLVAASSREYFLATAADRIYVDPAGGIRLLGIAASSVFFKGVFDKLGVTAQFIKIDEYKSAPESYTRTGPTEPALRMRNELYDDIYRFMVAGIAERRGLSEEKVEKLIDEGPYTAGDLAKSRLVDGVGIPEEISKLVIKDLGRPYRVAKAVLERPERWSIPAIAIIYLDGDIVSGNSRNIPIIDRKMVGGETIAKAIAAARAHRGIKAIVLRIDSPGGSALASEMMAREVFKTRGVKPIICSMGDLAASGGYFAAAGCETIFAQPTTITGSIGIFTGKFDFSGILGRLGLGWITYKRGQRADMESYFRPYSDTELTVIHDKLRYLYGRFTKAVAEGRSMTRKQVDDVGRGRVWSGRAAKDKKLVDRFGGLADAIALAKDKAGLGKDARVRIVKLPVVKAGLLDLVLGGVGVHQGQRGAGRGDLFLPGDRTLIDSLPASLWHQPTEVQARLPFNVVWH